MKAETMIMSQEMIERQRKENNYRIECKSRGAELVDYDLYKKYKYEELLDFFLVLMIFALLFIIIGIKIGGQI